MKRHLLNVSLLAAGMLCGATAMAQDQVVKITTSKAQGEKLTFRVNQVKRGVTVDWGDGNPVAYAADGNDLLTIEGTLKGEQVTITASNKWNTLLCEDNQITSLDVKAATSLTSLYCQDNELTTLDLSTLSALTDLNCSNNKLTKLVLVDTQQPALENVNVANNELQTNTTSTTSTTFYLKSSGLQHLNVAGNKFKTLNLTANRDLDVLVCNNNEFENRLNLLMNDSISAIVAHDNGLQTLSLPSTKGAPLLRKVVLTNNKFATLDFEKSLGLHTLMCANNQLTTVTLPPKTKIDIYACENNNLTFNSLPTKRYMPTHMTYSPQSLEVDITSLLKEDDKGYYVDICPAWTDRLNKDYIVAVHDLLLDADGQRTTVASWKKMGKTGEWEDMTKATVVNPQNDFFAATSSATYGNAVFFNAYDKVRCTLTNSNYPELTYNTTTFRVKAVNEGIGQAVASDTGLSVAAAHGQLTLQAGTDVTVRVVNMAGQMVWNGSVAAGSVQQVSLPSGVYVVNGQKVVL